MSGSQGEQNVSGQASETRVTGVDEYHAVYHDRARAVDRTAFSLDAVYGFEFPGGIEIPHHPAILGGISAQVPVIGSGKHYAGN